MLRFKHTISVVSLYISFCCFFPAQRQPHPEGEVYILPPEIFAYSFRKEVQKYMLNFLVEALHVMLTI